jgi:Trehalose utilisation
MRHAIVTVALLVVFAGPVVAQPFEEISPPPWVRDITRMAFGTPGEVDRIADAGVQVLHTNLVWPYYPLRRDGGGLAQDDRRKLEALVAACHKRGLKIILGLPPFMPLALAKEHPEWRIRASAGAVLKPPSDKDLGTRSGCNHGRWGDYLIGVCAELIEDFGLDGYSFDGNYHPPLCHCPACQADYQKTGHALPPRPDLNEVAYRQYLVWRGERLEEHYRKLVVRLRKANPDAALMTWTVNAGRYGHFLHSPRAMPTRLNRLIDLPMQEWWLDETNLGASVAPAFGAAYLRAVAGDRPTASEPYLMSRGNPYGTDSFPHHERLTRSLLALTHGSVAAYSFGWPGHGPSTRELFNEVAQRSPWLKQTQPLPWAALLVSEQTRQFYAYQDIAGRYLPHVFGAFRAALEEHLPLALVNDWDLNAKELAKYRVLVLANAAALSDAQAAAVRQYVEAGGGLVMTGETSLFDALGRPRHDFALGDLIGVAYRGRPRAPEKRPELDENFAITLDESYWKERVGVARLSWTDHLLLRDERLAQLVPTRSVTFRGPLVWVSEPKDPATVAWRMTPEGWAQAPMPGAICRSVGKGKVVYLASAIDAALWSYAYPYQRRLLARAMEWAAAEPPSITVTAPMCVQATYWTQADKAGRRVIVHLFNNVNTTAGHGFPAAEVPLREEAIPIGGIRVRFERGVLHRVHLEPGGRELRLGADGSIEVPPLERHALIVAEQ